MKSLKVKITNSPPKPAWYHGMEGEIFEVYEDRNDYIVKEDYDLGHKSYWRHIDKNHCEEVD